MFIHIPGTVASKTQSLLPYFFFRGVGALVFCYINLCWWYAAVNLEHVNWELMWIKGHIYHCGCVEDWYLLPYQNKARWLPSLLKKLTLYICIWAPGTHILWYMGYICGCMDYQVLSSHLFKAGRLLWLLRKNRSFEFVCWAPGALDFRLLGSNGKKVSSLNYIP